MQEITRIHIAKISYDIEIAAKKDLESYLKTLEAYSDDTDIIEDVEIRITEILAERGIKKDGVVSKTDVKALRQQLGEPREFMGEGDITIGRDNEEALSGTTTRKLYRNTDNAVLGGVLSGIAAFFNVNPLWVRLLFIVIALASFGAAILVYAVLWIAVPPAKSAADKLQMTGREVTLTSIRALNENEATRSVARSDTGAHRVTATILGVLSVLAALGAAALTTTGIVAIVVRHEEFFSDSTGSGFFIAAFVLAIVSGVLLTALFTLLAYAAFAQKMTRRIVISSCVIVVLGLATFGTAIGLGQYGSLRYDSVIKNNTHEAVIELPAGSKSATTLSVDAQGINLQYIVDPIKSSAVMRSVVMNGKKSPNAQVTLESGTLKITAEKIPSDVCSAFWCDMPHQTIIVYGPALESMTVGKKSSVEYHASQQSQLTVVAKEDADVSIAEGSTIDTLSVTADSKAEIVGALATVAHLKATIKESVSLEFGTIESLTLDDQKSCPANARSNIELWKISSNTVTLNGEARAATSMTMDCTKLQIESEDEA